MLKLNSMKKTMKILAKLILAVSALFASIYSFCQTPMDTVKTGKANDPMIVNPGPAGDKMAVKPAKPNDGMSMLTDTGFVNKNMMDNMMEIEMAKMGRDKGTTDAVKKVASAIITDHTAILNELERVSKKRGSSGGNMKAVAAPPLEIPNGSDFNKEWAARMLTMHDAKIAELESFLGLTKDAELKAIVLKALPKIKAHRAMLEKIPGAKEKAGASPTI
jgi:predicted outer membrane protein